MSRPARYVTGGYDAITVSEKRQNHQAVHIVRACLTELGDRRAVDSTGTRSYVGIVFSTVSRVDLALCHLTVSLGPTGQRSHYRYSSKVGDGVYPQYRGWHPGEAGYSGKGKVRGRCPANQAAHELVVGGDQTRAEQDTSGYRGAQEAFGED